MFAHQIIRTIEKLYLPNSGEVGQRSFTQIIDEIKNSQMFHFGRADELQMLYKSKKEKFQPFQDPLNSNLRLPYKKCWFDYTTYPEDDPYLSKDGDSTCHSRPGCRIFSC